MRRRPSLPTLLAVAGGIGVVGILAAIWISPLPALPILPSRSLSIGELRSGTDFTLGGVHFVETGFSDFQDGPVADGGYVVSFEITFPDGTSEHINFPFDGYCPAGSVDYTSTVHQGPAARFRYVCGEGSILVTVAS